MVFYKKVRKAVPNVARNAEGETAERGQAADALKRAPSSFEILCHIAGNVL